jgi:hypothetical protein
MNIEENNIIIAEQKRKANLVNNLAIDFEHLKTMAPQVMYNNAVQVKPEFKELCKFVSSLCDSVESGIAELKTIIPTFNE